MDTSFASWYAKRLLKESDDPVAQWQAMRAQVPGLGGPKPAELEPARPQKPGLPAQAVEMLTAGLRSGGVVPDALARALDLGGRNSSFVADSMLIAGRGGAYPFYREKRAGVPTGRFAFVQGFPVERLLREL
jgi:hypothetical protein